MSKLTKQTQEEVNSMFDELYDQVSSPEGLTVHFANDFLTRVTSLADEVRAEEGGDLTGGDSTLPSISG